MSQVGNIITMEETRNAKEFLVLKPYENKVSREDNIK
jgi:hypothetical protein